MDDPPASPSADAAATEKTAEELVFVPGTLRRGGADACRMADATFLAIVWMTGELYRHRPHPPFHPRRYGRTVAGELYRVSREKLSELDRFHGMSGDTLEGREHCRTRARAFSCGPIYTGEEVWVWVWKGTTEGMQRVVSGDWLDVELPRPAPLFTFVATTCLIGLPGGFLAAAILHQIHPQLAALAFLLGLISPWAGLFAAHVAQTRRERWRNFRSILIALLVLAAIPGVFVLYKVIANQLRLLA